MLDKNNLLALSQKQRLLDTYIFENQKLTNTPNLMKKKLIAFLVELGEYANEERCFKYWSKKAAAPLDKQLDEYIDGLHFLLSLGNDLNFDFSQFDFSLPKVNNLLDQYFVTIKHFQQLISTIERTVDNKKLLTSYQELLNAYFGLAHLANYQTKEILVAYQQKNKINFQRQANNY